MQRLPIDIWKHIEEYRLEYNPEKHTYVNLARTGNLGGIRWLKKHRPEIRCSPLAGSLAALHGQLEAVKLFHEMGIRCNPFDLICAAQFGHLDRAFGASPTKSEVVRFLYENGIRSRRVMDAAVVSRDLKMVRLLHELGVPFDTHALATAVQFGETEIATYLRGIRDVKIKCECGRTLCKKNLERHLTTKTHLLKLKKFTQ